MSQDPGDLVGRLDAVPPDVVERAKSAFGPRSGDVEYAVLETAANGTPREAPPTDGARSHHFIHPSIRLTVDVIDGGAGSDVTVTIEPPMAVELEVLGLDSVFSARAVGGQARLTRLPHGTVTLRVHGVTGSTLLDTEPFEI
jgi:hypothetical protein